MYSVFYFFSKSKYFQDYWDQISTLSHFNFLPLKEAKLEKRIFARSLYSKNIYIPSKVNRYDIHFRLSIEQGYQHYNCSPSTGLVLHLRKVNDIFPMKSMDFTGELTELAMKLNRKYQKMLLYVKEKILKKKMNNYGADVIKEIEDCRRKNYSDGKKTCNSLEKCYQIIEKWKNINWIKANNSWYTI